MLLIEYSVKEDSFHVEEVSKRLQLNIDLVSRGISKDYATVGVAITREQADFIIQRIKERINQRIYSGVN